MVQQGESHSSKREMVEKGFDIIEGRNMRNLDAPMTFYADKQAYKYAMCDNGCAYAAVEGEKLCKRCLNDD